jgi:type VI secretion system protein ImpK
MAGEQFFQYLQQILGRPDGEDVADLLEVYELCLLLGFKGRYSASRGAELQVIAAQVSEKIERVHAGIGELSPAWRPSPAEIAQPVDRWVPRLIAGAAAAVVLALVLYVGFAISLHSGTSEVAGLTTQLVR